MIKLGDNNVTLKLGDNDVSKVYLGENQIYPSAPATNLVMQRISETEYLVTGDSGAADLTFTRESDSLVDAKGVQGLPYTFTHTAGEKWSVNGVNAWAVDIPLGGYLEANNGSALELNDDMSINFSWTGVGGTVKAVFGKIDQTIVYDRWYVAIRNGNIGLWTQSEEPNTPLDIRTSPISIGYVDFKYKLVGNQVTQTVNGVDTTTTIDISKLAYVSRQTTKFVIGWDHSRGGTNMVMTVQNYRHGTEVFPMQEGTGTTTTGSEGTVLNLEGGATWIKI